MEGRFKKNHRRIKIRRILEEDKVNGENVKIKICKCKYKFCTEMKGSSREQQLRYFMGRYFLLILSRDRTLAKTAITP